MTVTSTVMEIGAWDLTLSPQAPGRIWDGLGEHAMVIITKGHVPVDLVEGLDEPLFRGIVLDWADNRLSGTDMAWLMGTPTSKGYVQDSGWGPWVAGIWDQRSPAAVMNDICVVNGLRYTIGPGVTGTMVGGVNGTPRTALERVVCPQLGCEWRMRTSGTIELHKRANALAEPVAVLTDDPGGQEPGVVSWQISDLDPRLADEDRRNRVVLRWDNDGSQATSATPIPTGWQTYRGASLEMAEFRTSAANRASHVATERDFLRAVYELRTRGATVTVSDPGAIAMLPDPGGLVGSAIGLYVPNMGFYDESAVPVPFRGKQIWPVSIRVGEVTWPITRGMGVYLDSRWARNGSGTVVDVTDWVDWEADPADPGSSSTTLQLGHLPRWWGGKVRHL